MQKKGEGDSSEEEKALKAEIREQEIYTLFQEIASSSPVGEDYIRGYRDVSAESSRRIWL